jgi:hypothetical protein
MTAILKYRRRTKRFAGASGAVSAVALLSPFVAVALSSTAPAGAAQVKAPACTADVGGSGLSAAVVAKSRETITHRTIVAAGCDIGVYVGAGVTHVTIDQDHISEASFQGILAQDTSDLAIKDSTVTGNGWNTVNPKAPVLPNGTLHSFVSQSFGISLFGVSDAVVANNKVYDNGRGGIGLMDNGPNDPGTIHQNKKARLVASSDVEIMDNTTWENYGGCGIVAATQNFGGRLSNFVITGNAVTGTGVGKHGPDIGGIVVAADLPDSTVSNVVVHANEVTGSFEGGLIVNAEAFGSSTRNVSLTSNTVEKNNYGHLEAPNTAGIIVFANNNKTKIPPKASAPENVATTVSDNTVADQFFGAWSVGRPIPNVVHNDITVLKGGRPISVQ